MLKSVKFYKKRLAFNFNKMYNLNITKYKKDTLIQRLTHVTLKKSVLLFLYPLLGGIHIRWSFYGII